MNSLQPLLSPTFPVFQLFLQQIAHKYHSTIGLHKQNSLILHLFLKMRHMLVFLLFGLHFEKIAKSLLNIRKLERYIDDLFRQLYQFHQSVLIDVIELNFMAISCQSNNTLSSGMQHCLSYFEFLWKFPIFVDLMTSFLQRCKWTNRRILEQSKYISRLILWIKEELHRRGQKFDGI